MKAAYILVGAILPLIGGFRGAEDSSENRDPITLERGRLPGYVLAAERQGVLPVPETRVQIKHACRQVWTMRDGRTALTYLIAADTATQAVGSAEAYQLSVAAIFDEGSPSGKPLGDRAWHGGHGSVLYTWGRVVVFVGWVAGEEAEDIARSLLGVLKARYPDPGQILSGPITLGKNDLSGFELKEEREWEWPVPTSEVTRKHMLRIQEWERGPEDRWTTTVFEATSREETFAAAAAFARGAKARRQKLERSETPLAPMVWMRKDGGAFVWVLGRFVTCAKYVGSGKIAPAAGRRFAREVAEALRPQFEAAPREYPPRQKVATSQPQAKERNSPLQKDERPKKPLPDAPPPAAETPAAQTPTP